MAGPHDALFRATLAKPENAIAELRRVLPPALVARIDFATLEMRPSRFVDPKLEGRESDLLFAVNLDSSETLIYVLVEHQSRVDWTMPIRLLRYMASVWERYVEERPSVRKVPPIIPVVVHHSASGWTVTTRLAELLDIDYDVHQAIAAHLPDFEFVLHDLAREDFETLRSANLPAQLKFSLFLLQRTRGNADLESELTAWTSVARQLAEETLRLVMSYILRVTEADPASIGDWAQRVSSQAQEAYVTAAEKIAQQVEQRERAKALDGRRELVSKLIERRFGPIGDLAQGRLAEATEEQLDQGALRVLDATSIEGVFEG